MLFEALKVGKLESDKVEVFTKLEYYTVPWHQDNSMFVHLYNLYSMKVMKRK